MEEINYGKRFLEKKYQCGGEYHTYAYDGAVWNAYEYCICTGNQRLSDWGQL